MTEVKLGLHFMPTLETVFSDMKQAHNDNKKIIYKGYTVKHSDNQKKILVTWFIVETHMYNFTQITVKEVKVLLSKTFTAPWCLFCLVTPEWEPCQCWGGVCRVRRQRSAGVTLLGWGEVNGRRWGESQGREKTAPHCCRRTPAGSHLGRFPTQLLSCSFYSYWTLSCSVFGCHPSSWWEDGSPENKTGKRWWRNLGTKQNKVSFIQKTDSHCVVWSRVHMHYTQALRWHCASTV